MSDSPYQPAEPAPQRAPETAVGTVALIVAIAAIVVSLVMAVVIRLLVYSDNGISAYQAVSLVGGLFTLLLAVTALVLGIMGLRRGRAGRGRSGVAAGIAIAILVSQVSAFALGALTGIFSRIF